jgi:uncharacterized membrane protein (DUF373 family)
MPATMPQFAGESGPRRRVSVMALGSYGREWQKFADYGRFEQVALGSVLVLLGAITVFAIVLVAIQLINDFFLGASFLDKAALQDTFGSILTIIILLEFNHSVYVALTHKSGAIQVRIVVLIAVLVVARKLMLQDFGAANAETLLGFAGLLLALGALYWLISNADRQSPLPAAPHEAPDAAKPGTRS